MDRWRGKLAIVTGAAGGIGAAVVEQLLQEDLKVAAVDYSPTRLEELTKKHENKTGLHMFVVDVTKDDEVVNLYQEITQKLGPVHILVNCAGIIRHDSLIDGNTENWKAVLDTNVLGVCIMTREAIRIMRENKIDGHIVHLSSIAGRVVLDSPKINLYPASKFAVRALTETHRQELNRCGLKIKVTCICPGRVNTLILENNNAGSNKNHEQPILEPKDVADSILYALSTPPHVQVHEICIKPVGETYPAQ